MKKKSLFLYLLSIVFLFPALGHSQQWQEIVEQLGKGNINWTKGVVQATGIGVPPERFYGKPQARPMALRAAQLDAYRNLLEITQGVRINSETTVKNYVTENDVIMSKVRGLVKGAHIVKQDYMSDGTVEVILEMTLKGEFTRIILSREIEQAVPARPYVAPPPAEKPTQDYSKIPPPAELKSLSKIYTGLIVNTKGLNTRPAMSPKIVDEDGKEVYGSAYVSREFAVQQGMSGYAKDIASAEKNTRVTDNPFIVKGLKTSGPGSSDIVISNADASVLRTVSENLSFLKKCRVMIVVD